MRNQALRLLQRASAGAAAGEVQRTAAACTEQLLAAAGRSSAPAAARHLATLPRLQQQAALASWQAAALPLAARGVSSSAQTSAEALTAVAVEGDVESLLKELDRIVCNEAATAKDIADAAVALTYLQVKGNRRVWGKVFEKAQTLKTTFDAASLPAFLWAATTANVTHFKTIFELSGAAASALQTLSPAGLSIVVEAFGKAGVLDAELHTKIADHVIAKINEFKPAELARILWGFAASGAEDGRLAKAISKALGASAAELAPREAAQALWALAALRRVEKPVLDALAKALKGKGGLESASDAGAAAWAAATLGYKTDTSALAAALKSGAADLSPAQAIQAAWGLALSGGDKDAVSALFAVAAAAIDKAPCSVDPALVGQLFEAAVAAPDAKLPENVRSYAQSIYSVTADTVASKRGSAALALRADVANAAAHAAGARYRPEIATQLKSFRRVTPEGITIDLAVNFDKENVAIEAVDAHQLTSTAPHNPTGQVIARARVLNSLGYKVVLVPELEWATLQDNKAKAQWLLTNVRSAAPSVAARIDKLSKKLNEPFDAYAD